jgi:hypothetical protein
MTSTDFTGMDPTGRGGWTREVNPVMLSAGYAVQRRAPAVERHLQLVDAPPTKQPLLLDG